MITVSSMPPSNASICRESSSDSSAPEGAPPRVLHVVDSLQTGGLERLVHDLVIARGADATSVACLESIGVFGESLRNRGIHVERIGKRGFGSTLWRMRAYLRRVQPDVVHCHNLSPFLIGGLAARFAGGIPVVMTKHGIKP